MMEGKRERNEARNDRRSERAMGNGRHDAAELSRSFQSFGSWTGNPETGPKSIGIGLCRFVGTAPGILGLVSSGLGALGPKATCPVRIRKLGRTYGRISDGSFGGRAEKRHEMALCLAPGADCTCVLHHFSSLTRLKGSWGQAWPENGPKPKLK